MSEIKPIETEYNGYRFRSRLEARWAVFFDSLGIEYEYEPEGFELPSGKRYLPDFRVKCYGDRGKTNETPYDLWIEVKGEMTEEDERKLKEFAYGGHLNTEYSICCDDCPIKFWGENPEKHFADLDWVHNEDIGGHDLCCSCGKELGNSPENIPDSFVCDLGDTPVDVQIWKFEPIVNKVLVVGNIPEDIYPSVKNNDLFYNYELIDGDYFPAYPAGLDGKFYLWGGDGSYIHDTEVVEVAYANARKARFEHGEKPEIKRTKRKTAKRNEEKRISLYDYPHTSAEIVVLSQLVKDPTMFPKLWGFLTPRDFMKGVLRDIAEVIWMNFERHDYDAESIIKYFSAEQLKDVVPILGDDMLDKLTEDEKKDAIKEAVIVVKTNSLDKIINTTENVDELFEAFRKKKDIRDYRWRFLDE